MLQAAEGSGMRIGRGIRILEFGCGAGRMLRHLKHLADGGQIWGTDISAEHIYWCRRHLEPTFRFFTCTTLPHLPFPDGYFDLVYAGSVFTHIDDLAEAWLLELRRITTSHGRLYVTVHDEGTLRVWEGKDNAMTRALLGDPSYQQAKNGFGMWVVGRGAGSQVFYSRAYIERTLRSMFELLRRVEEAFGSQPAYLLTPGTRALAE